MSSVMQITRGGSARLKGNENLNPRLGGGCTVGNQHGPLDGARLRAGRPPHHVPSDLQRAPGPRQLQQQRHLAAELEAVADLDEAGIPTQVLQDRGVDLAAGRELHGHPHEETGLAAAVGGRRFCHSTFTTIRVTSSAGASPPRKASRSSRIFSPSPGAGRAAGFSTWATKRAAPYSSARFPASLKPSVWNTNTSPGARSREASS